MILLPMISRLEGAVCAAYLVAMTAFWAGWPDIGKAAATVFFVLMALFAARLVVRLVRGAGWDDAWGRKPNLAETEPDRDMLSKPHERQPRLPSGQV